MLKIRCTNCDQCFTWTDDMPFKGRCPNPDCEGNYDVHETLKKSIAARTRTTSADAFACPACGRPIPSCWTICRSCGRIVAGSRTFRKRNLFLTVVFILIALSLLGRYVFRL